MVKHAHLCRITVRPAAREGWDSKLATCLFWQAYSKTRTPDHTHTFYDRCHSWLGATLVLFLPQLWPTAIFMCFYAEVSHMHATFSTHPPPNAIPVLCNVLTCSLCTIPGCYSCHTSYTKVSCCAGVVFHVHIYCTLILFNIFNNLKNSVNAKYETMISEMHD